MIKNFKNRIVEQIKSVVKEESAKTKNEILQQVIVNREETDKRATEIREQMLNINHYMQKELTEVMERQKNSGNLVLDESTVISKIFSGLKLYMDPHDIAVFPHIALDGVWEHRITGAWLKVVRPQDTVVDIGANFGYYGALAAQKSDPKKSKVIFFEANPHLISYLHKTLSVNWLNQQSVVENKAISDKQGQLTLHLLEGYIGSSSIHSAEQVNSLMGKKMNAQTHEKIAVDAVSLDDYCNDQKIKSIDLIKMDIEGFEEQAYRGMRGIVASSPELTMFVEFTAGAYDKPKEFFETMLKDFGNLYQIEDDGHILKAEKPKYEELVAERSDWKMFIFSKRKDLATRKK